MTERPNAPIDKQVLTILVLLFVFLYVISPIDIIPDPIPVLGWIDDLAVIVLGATFVINQLR